MPNILGSAYLSPDPPARWDLRPLDLSKQITKVTLIRLWLKLTHVSIETMVSTQPTLWNTSFATFIETQIIKMCKKDGIVKEDNK